MKRALAICAIFGWVSAIHAHPVAQGSMDVAISSEKIHVRVRVSLEEIFVENSHAPIPAVSLAQASEKHGDYLLKHLHLFANERALAGPRLAIAGIARAGEHACYLRF